MEGPFKKVNEAIYLATDKSDKYRAILRHFYIQHERLREFLLPEEVFTHLKSIPHFATYEMEELHSDLASLVKWGNLRAQQESGKVKSIEEFKKKRFRYQITPYTVEFERMLIQFENQSEQFGGSLEKSHFERLYQTLQRIKQSADQTPESCAQLWDDVLTYFKKITQSTSDYFAYLRSEDASEQMKSESFYLYKDQFTRYLRDFIINLQRTAASIQDVMISIRQEEMSGFFQKVSQHEETVFRFERLGEQVDYVTELEATWGNVKAWFIGDETGESQYENVLVQTNEAIRRMTRIIQRLGERSMLHRSRKEDYLHLAKWFSNMSSIDEAHKLSSIVFGMSHTKHLYSDHISTEDIYTDVWNEAPMAHERIPRIRAYREKTKANPVVNHSEKKENAKAAYLERRQHEQQVITQYLQGNTINLAQLPVIEPFVRKLFLSWIGKAMAKADRTIKTEYGDIVKIELDRSQTIVLEAEDGQMSMPAVNLLFLGKEKEKHELA